MSMTGQEVVDMLQYRLGNRTDLATVALLEMKLAQTKLEGMPTLPWFLEQSYTTAFATTANQEYVSLPASFLSEKDEGSLFYEDTSITTPDQWVELVKDGYSVMKEYYKEEVAGEPVKYDLVGSQLFLRPIPDAIYNLRLIGFFQDSVITLGAANQWLTYAPDVILASAGEVLASRHIQDRELAKNFASDFQIAYTRMKIDTERRLHANRTYSMGDD